MYTAVVKFDTLSDTVWTAAKDHDLRFICIYRILIFSVVSRVVVSAVFGTTYVYAFPCFCHAELDSLISDVLLRNLKDLAEVSV